MSSPPALDVIRKESVQKTDHQPFRLLWSRRVAVSGLRLQLVLWHENRLLKHIGFLTNAIRKRLQAKALPLLPFTAPTTYSTLASWMIHASLPA